jgi:hypothetical protein
MLSPTTQTTVSKGMPRTHDTLLRLNTSLPEQMVKRQEEAFRDVPLQLLLAIATPVKFSLKAFMCCDASAIVGWGPVHLMPARRMRPLPPRTNRLHSAAPAADAPASWGLCSSCAEGVLTMKQERIASQPAAAQAMANLHTDSNSGSKVSAVSVAW